MDTIEVVGEEEVPEASELERRREADDLRADAGAWCFGFEGRTPLRCERQSGVQLAERPTLCRCGTRRDRTIISTGRDIRSPRAENGVPVGDLCREHGMSS